MQGSPWEREIEQSVWVDLRAGGVGNRQDYIGEVNTGRTNRN